MLNDSYKELKESFIRYIIEDIEDNSFSDDIDKQLYDAIFKEYDYKKIIDLVNNGANVNIKDEDGWYALNKIIVYGEEDLVKLFIEHGANIEEANNSDKNFNILQQCFRSLKILNYLLEQNLDKTILNKALCFYCWLSCQGDYLDYIKSLIEHGADVNYKDEENRTPLIYASIIGEDKNKEVIDYLISQGAE